MNDLLATLSPRGKEWMSAEVVSIPYDDEEGGTLMSMLEQFGRAQHELETIDECLHNLAEAHQKSMAVHTANASRDLKESIESNIHLILLNSRSLQAMLRDLAPGHPIAASMAKSMTKSLKDRMNSFNDLRAIIEADYREAVGRHWYIVSGQIPSAQEVDRMMESGRCHNFLREAIEKQNPANFLDLEKRQDGVRDLQRDLQELQQIFAAMAALVLDQAHDIDDIQKNVAESASALNSGVAQLGGAAQNARGASKWIWGSVVLILVLVVVVAIVLVLVSLVGRDRSSNFVLFGFVVCLI